MPRSPLGPVGPSTVPIHTLHSVPLPYAWGTLACLFADEGRALESISAAMLPTAAVGIPIPHVPSFPRACCVGPGQ